MKKNNEPVIREMERLSRSRIPGDILEFFRYDLKDHTISKKDWKRMSSTLVEFMYSASKTSITHIPLGVDRKLSLTGACIYIDSYEHSPKKHKVKVYFPGSEPEQWTATVHKIAPVRPFRDELIFWQDNEIIEFENLVATRDFVAISKEAFAFGGKHIVIHYVP